MAYGLTTLNVRKITVRIESVGNNKTRYGNAEIFPRQSELIH